jgi:hypothetical protein
MKQSTEADFNNAHQGVRTLNSEAVFEKEKLEKITSELAWQKENSFGGLLVPPRPNAEEMKEGATPLGPLCELRGLVLQKGLRPAIECRALSTRRRFLLTSRVATSARAGPFNGIFIRAGVVPRFPWVERFYLAHYPCSTLGTTPVQPSDQSPLTALCSHPYVHTPLFTHPSALQVGRAVALAQARRWLLPRHGENQARREQEGTQPPFELRATAGLCRC